MLACRTHPLFLSLLATYTVPPFSDYAIPRLRTRPCNVEYESTPSRLELSDEYYGPSIRDVKARARSTWHTDRHTSSLQHLGHDLVSTMQPREPASLLNESCGGYRVAMVTLRRKVSPRPSDTKIHHSQSLC